MLMAAPGLAVTDQQNCDDDCAGLQVKQLGTTSKAPAQDSMKCLQCKG